MASISLRMASLLFGGSAGTATGRLASLPTAADDAAFGFFGGIRSFSSSDSVLLELDKGAEITGLHRRTDSDVQLVSWGKREWTHAWKNCFS